MRNSTGYVMAYAAGICLASSLLLAATSSLLRNRQERMAEADRKYNVLKAFQADVTDEKNKKIGTAAIETLYSEHVQEAWFDRSGTEIPGATHPEGSLQLFRWTENGAVTRYALPIAGQGLWGMIYGYLALDRDLKDIVGVTFYKHQETPGLGGEIEKDSFVKPFQGQSILAADGSTRSVEVIKGVVTERYPRGAPMVAVDGISGATLTGRGVSDFMTADLKAYEPVFQKLRTNRP